MSSRAKGSILVLLVPLLVGFDPFRSANEAVEQGNAKLGAKKYKEALERYDAAAKDLPQEPGVHYNRGIALHRLGRHKEAAEALSKATIARDKQLKSKSLYNLGNALMAQKRFKDAAEAYKGALRIRPGHEASKWNLELALRKIQKKKKEEEKKKKQKQKKKQDKDKKDQKQRQDQKNQNKDRQPQDQNQDKRQQDKKQQKDKRQQDKRQQDSQDDKKKRRQPQPSRDKKQPRPSPSQRQMDSVLDALDRSDKNLQKRRARMRRGRGFRRPTKDW